MASERDVKHTFEVLHYRFEALVEDQKRRVKDGVVVKVEVCEQNVLAEHRRKHFHAVVSQRNVREVGQETHRLAP
eukprot:340465-Rhodomonas_salina.3